MSSAECVSGRYHTTDLQHPRYGGHVSVQTVQTEEEAPQEVKLPFGLEIIRRKDAVSAMSPADMGLSGSGGWFPLIREPFAGAWQRNQEITQDSILTFSTVFACLTLIAGDISKMCVYLVEYLEDVWQELENPAYSPVLRKPNHFQTHNQFFEQWVLSKLCYGNAYVRKIRDNRGVVTDLYVLHPLRVRALIAPNGDVYYDLNFDQLAEQPEERVPASEIIHDRFNCLYHPLCGVSPIAACSISAIQGMKIQNNSTAFFNNNSNPGGILTAPHAISQAAAQRIKEHWEANYSGQDNIGRVAVLGDGLKYEPMMMSAHDAELVNQLKLSAEMICSVFHVPNYMVGVGPPPNYNNIEALNQQYYQQCLQVLIEAIEECLNVGLGLSTSLGTRFDLERLLRMDTLTATDAATKAIIGGLKKPNEARRSFDLPPVAGGNRVFLQQQNWPLDLLGSDMPKPTPTPTAEPAPPTTPEPRGMTEAEIETKTTEWLRAA